MSKFTTGADQCLYMLDRVKCDPTGIFIAVPDLRPPKFNHAQGQSQQQTTLK